MRYRAAIFDLDGTLVDSLPGIEASVRHAAAECFPGWEVPCLRSRIGPPIALIFRTLRPDLPSDSLDRLVAGFRRHYESSGCGLSTPYPGVPETLESLRSRGIRSFVLTNKPLRPTLAILDRTGMAEFFHDVISPDAASPSFQSKPEGAHALSRKHRLTGDSCWLVGDGQDDADAARACGFRLAVAGYGYGHCAAHPPADALATLATFSEIGRLSWNLASSN